MSSPSPLELDEQELLAAEQKQEKLQQALTAAEQTNDPIMVEIIKNNLLAASKTLTVLAAKYSAEFSKATTATTATTTTIKPSSAVTSAHPNIINFWNCLKQLEWKENDEIITLDEGINWMGKLAFSNILYIRAHYKNLYKSILVLAAYLEEELN
jgi:hypothetical protein